MRIILIVSLLAYNLAAMDLVEEELHPEQKLQRLQGRGLKAHPVAGTGPKICRRRRLA